jgi:hypothetical protein
MNKIRIYFQPYDRADEFKEVEIWTADEEMNFSLLKTAPGALDCGSKECLLNMILRE